jgi:hypothetical protein
MLELEANALRILAPTLRVAYRTDSRPFSYVDAQGRPVGYTIELCERIMPPPDAPQSSRSLPPTLNELVVDIRDRIPVILATRDYARWLGDEPNPGNLMRPFPADLMRVWPTSTQVNKPENDDLSILDPIELKTDAA